MTKKSDKHPYNVNILGVGGNIQGSNIVVGNNNVTQIGGGNIVTRNLEIIEAEFSKIKTAISNMNISQDSKSDLYAELDELFGLLTAEQDINESAITRRLRNIKRISPDTVEVILEILKNPIFGMSVIIKKAAESL